MRAFVIRGPREGHVEDLDDPLPGEDEVLVRVASVGLCGTDRELFDGSMPYLLDGRTRYPFVPGHEWSGVVVAAGSDASISIGTRVVGDVFIGCGSCSLCRAGHANGCPNRAEVGVLGNWPGAMEELLRVPARTVFALPPSLGYDEAVFIEPGVTSLHAIERCALGPGDRCAVYGSGTLGLIAVQIARHLGAAVDCITGSEVGAELARFFGATAIAPGEDRPGAYDVAIEAAGSTSAPSSALAAVRSGGRVGLAGIARQSGQLPANDVVLRNVTVSGALGGPGRFPAMIALIADGVVQTEPLIDHRVGLDDVASILASDRNPDSRPKVILQPNGAA